MGSDTFVARSGGCEEFLDGEDGWFEAGVSEHTDGSGRVLIFQCLLTEPDEQSRRLGLDTYCISNETGGSTYAGIESVEATAEILRVEFTAKAAHELGLAETTVEVSLRELPDDAIAQLNTGLRKVLSYGRADARPKHIAIGSGGQTPSEG